MKIKYDNIADAMYIRYSNNKVSYTKDNIEHDGIVDFDEKGNIIGIEMWGVKDIFYNNNVIIKNKEKKLELV